MIAPPCLSRVQIADCLTKAVSGGMIRPFRPFRRLIRLYPRLELGAVFKARPIFFVFHFADIFCDTQIVRKAHDVADARARVGVRHATLPQHDNKANKIIHRWTLSAIPPRDSGGGTAPPRLTR